MRYGILITPDTAAKAKAFLHALADAGDCETFSQYQPCDVLILYGLGGGYRFEAARNHLLRGRPFVAWDLPYWQRDGRTFRLSVNGNHPKTVMRGEYPGPQRFDAVGLATGSVAKPDGPILLIGNGPKSNAVGAEGWAKRKAADIRQAFPDRPILYRPKPKRPADKGCERLPVSDGAIDSALRGVSLVVCRHSNVAVDACRMGVPVVCDDGAASLIYPKDLKDKDNQPSESVRREFLHRLAWWQYNINETALAWEWIRRCASISAAGTGSRTAISI